MTTPCRHYWSSELGCTVCNRCHACGTTDRYDHAAHDWAAHDDYHRRQTAKRNAARGYALCAICHTAPATETDHIRPVNKHRYAPWIDDPSNLQPVCGPCNRAKSDHEPAPSFPLTPAH